MKVNDPNSLPANGLNPTQTNAAQTSKTQSVERAGSPPRTGVVPDGNSSGDDVHLSELVRSLRALAADSPELQARVEDIARSYAQGNYKVDADATAAGIIDDAIQHNSL
ncbi:MAG: flagellar biosynthesis anti-sigma factor FlgM [Acidobacteriota bacterium]